MQGLFYNTFYRVKQLKWSKTEALCHFIKGVARELKIKLPIRFYKYEQNTKCKSMLAFYDKEKKCFNFNGILLPDLSNDIESLITLRCVFEDVLLFPVYYNDDYSKDFVKSVDKIMCDGPYGYTDELFDVKVKSGDVVIDAGAWIGDFSAYASYKGATSYAFEPVESNYKLLCKTKDLNNNNIGKIIPVQSGLGDTVQEVVMCISNDSSIAYSIVTNNENNSQIYEQIKITTLDSFVESNNIKKIDFIKADIEGFERNLLLGAQKTLKKHAPKLAICTYHLPDDPEILEAIIKKANPQYKIVHLKNKLFATI